VWEAKRLVEGRREGRKDEPGATTFTRIDRWAYSFAMAREKPRTACFEAHCGCEGEEEGEQSEREGQEEKGKRT
jgi:hypothetical protein